MIEMFGIKDTLDLIDAEYICPNCREVSHSIVAVAVEYGNDESFMLENLKNNPIRFLKKEPTCNCQDCNLAKLILYQVIYCRTNPSSNEDLHQYIRYNTQFNKTGAALVVVNLDQKKIECVSQNKQEKVVRFVSKIQFISKGFDPNLDTYKQQNENHILFLTSDYESIIWINQKSGTQTTHSFVHLENRTTESITFIDEESKQWIISKKSIVMTDLNIGDTIAFIIETQ